MKQQSGFTDDLKETFSSISPDWTLGVVSASVQTLQETADRPIDVDLHVFSVPSHFHVSTVCKKS